MLRYYDSTPSLYETQCENGEIDEDGWRYEPVDCGDFYMIESYKYSNTFPKEWAQNHLDGTGPEQCENCYEWGSKDGVFLGYCLNCAKYDYYGERGPGLDAFNGALEIETSDFHENCAATMEDDLSKYCTPDCVRNSNPPPLNGKEGLEEIRTQFLECSRNLHFVFKMAGGEISEDNPRLQEFMGLEKE